MTTVSTVDELKRIFGSLREAVKFGASRCEMPGEMPGFRRRVRLSRQLLPGVIQEACDGYTDRLLHFIRATEGPKGKLPK